LYLSADGWDIDLLDETIYWAISGPIIVFMLLKVTEKILSDRNTCIVPLFYYLYDNIFHIIIVTSLILIFLNNNIKDNLYWDWKNWWRRQRLYFAWTNDTSCVAEIRFRCMVLGDDWHPVLFILLLLLTT